MTYKGIRDTADLIGVETHTLRFWEKKFPYLNPKKMGGSNRLYSPDDIAYLQQIHRYLKHEGYTTQGVLNLIKKHGIQAFRKGQLHSDTASQAFIPADFRHIQNVTQDIENILAKLKKLRTMI